MARVCGAGGALASESQRVGTHCSGAAWANHADSSGNSPALSSKRRNGNNL